MRKDKIAFIISRVFDIYTILPIIIFICFLKSSYNLSWSFLYILFLVVGPVLMDLYLLKNKKIKDWDLSQRKQRVKYLDFGAIALLGLVLFTYIFNAPLIFKSTITIIFITELLYTLITQFWKISIHAQLITLLIVFLTIYINPYFILLVFLLVLVFWSRIQLKMHTLGQLIAGSLLTLVISLIVLKFFGYY